MDKTKKTLDTLTEKLQRKTKVLKKRKNVLERMISELNVIPKKESKIQKDARIERCIRFLSYIVSYRLEDCIENKDWFFGILLSASVLEDLGKRKLKTTFAKKIGPKKIDRLTFEQTILMLFASNAIDEKTYTKMLEIKKARNDLAHYPIESLLLSLETYPTTERAKHAKSIIRKAIYSLKEIYPPTVPE